jgi:hypothetical protein
MEFIMPILVNKISIPDLGLEIDMDINATVIHKGSSFENYNAKAFYLNVIKQNLKDYYSDELNTRKVINACITLFHLADWYIPNDKNKRRAFQENIPFNGVLESIANGTKHCNKEKKYQTGKKEGSYAHTKLIVDDGANTYNLIDVLKAIEKYWDSVFL